MKVEEKYQDVLQNIEFAIVQVYKEIPDLTDYNALQALQAAMELYKAEQRQQTPKSANLNERDRRIYERIHPMCEWRLGRLQQKNPEPSTEEIAAPTPISVDEIMLCLKRLHKSVEFWNREAGRQGYLNYISQFIR